MSVAFAEVHVRRAQPEDREQIRQICQRSVLPGRPTEQIFEDVEIISRLFADYYLDYEPESCFVAEVNGRIVGYALACKDTRRYLRILFGRILPGVLWRIAKGIALRRYRRPETYRTLWWVLTRAWREIPSVSWRAYPGHVHVNVDPAFTEEKLALLRIGRRLGDVVMVHLRETGVRGIQGAVAEEEGDDRLTEFYRRFYGARIAAVRRFSLWERLTGTRWYAKLVVIDLHPIAERSKAA
ncbi:MAG: hypothetical protein N0A16_10905 [Blastocatellia bacterium]|nr:hypothetical protein [Blastocatellia bacterium]MCS7158224.1 hypothetical protein [Blastocatellia bacterium]MCX7753062.1 hypothetical protein [Blastocatellia bacterium]MDW8169378.1 hypothetical protein [Acidobacteriota bacterium]MDW8256445.1 hypothetical protein [Acidobacteriota bacterium]